MKIVMHHPDHGDSPQVTDIFDRAQALRLLLTMKEVWKRLGHDAIMSSDKGRLVVDQEGTTLVYTIEGEPDGSTTDR